MRARLLLLALVLVVSSIPLGAADWGSRGSREPDTAEDRRDQLMFRDPPGPATDVTRIYFNGWAGNGAIAALSLNPNSASLGSSIMQAPYRGYALLGGWRDCNADGFIGLGDNALLEYRSPLLNRTDICPPRPGSSSIEHNDGTWVREFFPIGPDCDSAERARVARGEMYYENCISTNPYNVKDERALVWADFKRPGEPPDATCPMTPPPTGALQSTGGMLRWIDCMDGWQATSTFNRVAHATGQHGLAFDDAEYHRPDKSKSPLNQQNPYGRPSGSPAVSAFDCGRERIHVTDSAGLTRHRVADPTGGLLWPVFGPDGTLEVYLSDEDRKVYLVAPPRSPPRVDSAGSLAGSVNETESALGDCDMREARNCGTAAHVGADQHTGGDVYCVVEDPRQATVREARRQVDVAFAFVEGGPSGDVGQATVDNATFVVSDEGLAPPTRNGWFWVGTETMLLSRNAFVDKDALQPRPVTYITHYAHVGPAVLDQGYAVPGGSRHYGSEWCIISIDPAINGGFDCNIEAWPGEVKPDQPYHLRDIDCYDASADGLRQAGVGWGMLTRTNCHP